MGHWLADVQLAVFAPAFTLSFHDSEYSRKSPTRIVSGVMRQFKKQKTNHEKTKIHNRYFDYYLFAD